MICGKYKEKEVKKYYIIIKPKNAAREASTRLDAIDKLDAAL